MSIECGECEHDLRGGHDESCSRHPKNRKPFKERRPRGLPKPKITASQHKLLAQSVACLSVYGYMSDTMKNKIYAQLRKDSENPCPW